MKNASTNFPSSNEVYISSPRTVLTVIFFTILIITCFLGNSCMCVLFYRYRRLRITSNYFIISLAISDLLVGAVAMPLWVSLELTGWTNLPPYIDVKVMKMVWQCLDIFCCLSSISNLSAISVERFFSICKPLQHRNTMTIKNTYCLIIIIWMYALLLTLLALIKALKAYYLLFIFIMGFILPLVIMFISYIGIYWASKHYVRRRRRSSDLLKIQYHEPTITKSLLILTSVFVVCWIPFFLYALLHRYCLTCRFMDTPESHVVQRLIKWLHYSNSAANPIIYGMFNAKFKVAFQEMLNGFSKKISRRKYTVSTENSDSLRDSVSNLEMKNNIYYSANEYPIDYRSPFNDMPLINKYSEFEELSIDKNNKLFHRLSVRLAGGFRPLSLIKENSENDAKYVNNNLSLNGLKIEFEEPICNDTYEIHERLSCARESQL